MVDAAPQKAIKWRAFLRAMHRDLGFLAVGLTFIYALSGLAVNHIEDWDPNFKDTENTHQMALPLPDSDEAIVMAVAAELQIDEPPADIYRAAPNRLDVAYENRTLHIDTTTGQVVEEGRSPRFLVRVANWLHLNRGKKAWTVIADLYAITLMLLAISGVVMLRGRRGIWGRGGLFLAAGVAVPILYVVFSGGP